MKYKSVEETCGVVHMQSAEYKILVKYTLPIDKAWLNIYR